MGSYHCLSEAIIDMHSRGFHCDFHIRGDELFCCQDNSPITFSECWIPEYHYIRQHGTRATDVWVFGIISHTGCTGILVMKNDVKVKSAIKRLHYTLP